MDAVAIENGKPWVVGRDYWVGDRVPPVKAHEAARVQGARRMGRVGCPVRKTFAFHRTWREAIIHALALANREYYSNLGGRRREAARVRDSRLVERRPAREWTECLLGRLRP